MSGVINGVIDIGGGYFWPTPDIPKGKIFEKPKEKEMSIPKLSVEEMAEEDQRLYRYYRSEEEPFDMSVYIDEVFRELDEDEEKVVIDPFVRDMCNYYKIKEMVPWQLFYDYLVEEHGATTSSKDLWSKVQYQLNAEMKEHVEENKELAPSSHDVAVWNAIEKHK